MQWRWARAHRSTNIGEGGALATDESRKSGDWYTSAVCGEVLQAEGEAEHGLEDAQRRQCGEGLFRPSAIGLEGEGVAGAVWAVVERSQAMLRGKGRP